MIPIVPCDSRRSNGMPKGVPSGTAVFLRLLVGELWTPELAQSFAYGKWLYPYRIILHGASDLDQRCLKTRNFKDGCTFPRNIFAPTTPKIIRKPHFGGHFSANPIIEREISVSRTLMELQIWNVQLYRSTLGFVEIFPLGGVRGAQGP